MKVQEQIGLNPMVEKDILSLNNGRNNNYDAGADGFNYVPQKPQS